MGWAVLLMAAGTVITIRDLDVFPNDIIQYPGAARAAE